MSDQDYIGVARAGVEAFNNKDWEKLGQLLTEDAVYVEPATGRRLQHRPQIIAVNQGWAQAFPDVTGRITNALASGDWVTLEVVWNGTHTGPLVTDTGTVPPSGQPVQLMAVQLVRVEGGQIKETHHYFDLLGMMMQIKAIPPF